MSEITRWLYFFQITTNLCTFLCSDLEFTPRLTEQKETNPYDGILTLNNRQRHAERVAYNRGAGSGGIGGGRGPGRPPATDIPLEELLACEEPEAKASRTRRRGATLALTAIGNRKFRREIFAHKCVVPFIEIVATVSTQAIRLVLMSRLRIIEIS